MSELARMSLDIDTDAACSKAFEDVGPCYDGTIEGFSLALSMAVYLSQALREVLDDIGEFIEEDGPPSDDDGWLPQIREIHKLSDAATQQIDELFVISLRMADLANEIGKKVSGNETTD